MRGMIMKKTLLNRMTIITLSIMLSVFGLFGCSNLPNQPETIAEFTIADFEAATNGENVGFVPFNMRQSSELVVATDGGSIDFAINRAESGSFEVAPNSIESNTNISIKVKEIYIRDKTILEFKFGPSGLVFSSDAKLILSVDAFDDPDMKYVDWYYYNPDTKGYQLEERIYVNDGFVVIPVSHFSKYVGISQGGQ
jgi:hypothetical protein